MYKRIFVSNDFRDIGSYPQVERTIEPDYKNHSEFIGAYRHEEAPSNVLVPIPLLSKKAKKTDLISGVSSGLSSNLLVSEKLKQILTSSNHYGIQFFDTKLISPDGKMDKYCIVHGGKYGYRFLDFKRSIFYLIEDVLKPKEKRVQVEIDNEEELVAMQERLLQSGGQQVVLLDTISILNECEVDLFSLSFIHNGGKGYFASHRLIEQINASNCTGIKFEQLNEQDPWSSK